MAGVLGGSLLGTARMVSGELGPSSSALSVRVRPRGRESAFKFGLWFWFTGLYQLVPVRLCHTPGRPCVVLGVRGMALTRARDRQAGEWAHWERAPCADAGLGVWRGPGCGAGALLTWRCDWSEQSSAGTDHAEEMELLLENCHRLAEDLAHAARELRALIDASQSVVFLSLDRWAPGLRGEGAAQGARPADPTRPVPQPPQRHDAAEPAADHGYLLALALRPDRSGLRHELGIIPGGGEGAVQWAQGSFHAVKVRLEQTSKRQSSLCSPRGMSALPVLSQAAPPSMAVRGFRVSDCSAPDGGPRCGSAVGSESGVIVPTAPMTAVRPRTRQ